MAESIITYFTPFYAAYSCNVTLYRMLFGHIFSPVSEHAQENREIRWARAADLGDCIRRAVDPGECAPDIDLEVQARSLFYLYFAAMRTWLNADHPDAGDGIAELQTIYAQHVRGMLPQPHR